MADLDLLNQGWVEVALPATCGELVQGTLDGAPCLVSCPIDRFSTARIKLRPGPGWQAPDDAPKSVSALQLAASHFACGPTGGELHLASEIPRGRGYGSSTADIGAALFALAQALSRPLPPLDAARLAVRIEPSDSTFFPGLALFDHVRATSYESWGAAPPLALFLLDPGGAVDTLAFHRQDHQAALARLAGAHRRAFEMLRQGLSVRDWEAVGLAASLSAKMHQAILHNPLFDLAHALSREVQALGLCRAHSGTILGILLDPQRSDLPAVEAYLQKKLPSHVQITGCQMVDGGPRAR